MRLVAPKSISNKFLRCDGYQRGSFETCVNVCREGGRLGGTVIDVGAHVGTWSVRFVPFFTKIVAIEADRTFLPFLAENVPVATIINARLGIDSRLDDIAMMYGRVDLIKIDIDGPNSSVIEGAMWLLDRDDPMLCIEMVSNEFFDDEALELLHSMHYFSHAHFGKDFIFVRNFKPASVPIMVEEHNNAHHPSPHLAS